MTDEQIIAIAKEIFGCEDICLSGEGERDREVTVCEYPIGEQAIQFARAILAAASGVKTYDPAKPLSRELARRFNAADGAPAPAASGWEPDAWADYIAGVLVSYLTSDNAAREADRREAAIAGIIRRRIHWLMPTSGVVAADGYRCCEFCGCNTNARACTNCGATADGVEGRKP